MKVYTHQDTGCYADGAHGHNHVRAKLAELVGELVNGSTNTEPTEVELLAVGAACALAGEMSDDALEETVALELLNEHTTDRTVAWSLLDGDLILSTVGDFDQ